MDNQRPLPSSERGLSVGSVFTLLALLTVPFVLTLGMMHGISHDEHQHIAAGALIAREGLLPYRDFPLFHTPYLSFIYAAIFRLGDHLLLGARLFSVVCATTTVALVGTLAWLGLRARSTRAAWAAALATVIACLASSLFAQSAGFAYNQEPSTLCALAAFVALSHGLDTTRGRWLFAGGALLGLAIGFRLTYAPLLAPFGLLTLLTGSAGNRWRAAVAFTAGVVVALAGVVALAIVAPERFLFDNFEFAKANIDYRLASGEPRTMTLGKKLRFLWKVVIRRDAGFSLATLLPIVTVLWCAARGVGGIPVRLSRWLFTLPFLLWGAFAPSPTFDQYYYPLVPFLALAAVDALASLPAASPAWRWNVRVGLASVALALVQGLRGGAYEDITRLWSISRWTTIERHDEAAALRTHLPAGARVLTLAPIAALEAGLRIDPAFATGPFAWRVAPYVEPAKAARLGLISPDTFAAHLAAFPPDAIHGGLEKTGDEPFIEYANRLGWQQHTIHEDQQLWTP